MVSGGHQTDIIGDVEPGDAVFRTGQAGRANGVCVSVYMDIYCYVNINMYSVFVVYIYTYTYIYYHIYIYGTLLL